MTTSTSHALCIARIDEATCIGCTLCIDACPFDAIVGAAKRMHTVLPALCTGCALCVPPCPVDCISMVPAGRAWSLADADAADGRRAGRDLRIVRSGAPTTTRPPPQDERDRRRAAVAAALARARARRVSFGSGRN